MNNQTQPAWETIAISALTALLVAVIAQGLSHWFSNSREGQKYYREVFQKLYAPILFDIFYYVDTATHFRKGHDVAEDTDKEIRDRFINHIGDNLMYASPRLISSYQHMKSYEYFDDQSGFLFYQAELSFYQTYLEEIDRFAKKTKLMDKAFRKQITKYKIYYLFWQRMFSLSYDIEKAMSMTSYKWRFDETLLTKRSYKQLKRAKGYDSTVAQSEEVATQVTREFASVLIKDKKEQNELVEWVVDMYKYEEHK